MENIKEQLLKRHPRLHSLLRFLKGRVRELFFPYRFRKYGKNRGFGTDRVLNEFVQLLAQEFLCTACVETGTCRADTALRLAEVFPRIPVYTIEVSDELFRESRWRLRNSANTIIIRNSSEKAIRDLIADKKLGELPLFFLDAHWHNYWPLKDELHLLAGLGKAIVMIHDFRVPERPEFQFDWYTTAAGAMPNDVHFIEDFLHAKRHHLLFPAYEAKDAAVTVLGGLRGYVVIFQDLHGEFNQLWSMPAVRNWYSRWEVATDGFLIPEPSLSGSSEGRPT